MKILGIETSCDDTCAAVVEDGRIIHSSCIASSAREQNLYGGVVPEIASRRHVEHISQVTEAALQQAGCTAQQLDGIAVTYAPGLIGALLVGVNFAKSVAYSVQKPLIAVHHLRGHIASLYLTHPQLSPPFLCLVASGGHSHIVQVSSFTEFTVLGRTIDDAAGEAFDKVARTLGLGYPGGPAVSAAAANGCPAAYSLPTPKAQGKYNVSFSGLKTAVLNTVHSLHQKGQQVCVADMAASFEHRITEILAEKLLCAAADTNASQICLAGGVAANHALRTRLAEAAAAQNIALYLPEMSLCGDNAAMIAAQGYYEFLARPSACWNHYALNAAATVDISEQCPEG